jgi:uncharacterized membrane protein YjjB (DUF3815 family)
MGDYLARRFESPTAIFTVPAVIPMVPGTFAFRTMLGILEITTMGVFGSTPVLVEASLNAVKTGLILAALAGGSSRHDCCSGGIRRLCKKVIGN